MKKRLAVLVSGSGSNLQAVIDACHAGLVDAEVALVVSSRPDVFALDRAETAGIASVVHDAADYRRKGIDRRTYDRDLAEIVDEVGPHWIVLAGWMRILSAAFLDAFPGRVINLHPALPGTFPGAHAIDDAWQEHVQSGLDHTGVMVHLVPDEAVDAGPVLAQAVVPITADDTLETLTERIHTTEHRLLVDVLQSLCG